MAVLAQVLKVAFVEFPDRHTVSQAQLGKTLKAVKFPSVTAADRAEAETLLGARVWAKMQAHFSPPPSKVLESDFEVWIRFSEDTANTFENTFPAKSSLAMAPNTGVFYVSNNDAIVRYNLMHMQALSLEDEEAADIPPVPPDGYLSIGEE